MIELQTINLPHRECGECQACCTVLAVAELNKPELKPCEHLCANGCSRYETRPGQCRDWSCLWLHGIIPGDERRRPDKLGLIFDIQPQILERFKVSILVAYEVWAGASETNAAAYLLQKLGQKYIIMVNRWDGTYRTIPPQAFTVVEGYVSQLRPTS